MITDIAQAVVDHLNDQSFSMPVTARRVALPEFDLADMQELHVTVAPRQVESAVLDRGRDVHDVQIDVAVQKKVASVGNEAIDPLLALVREMADALNRRNLGGALWRTRCGPRSMPATT